MYMCICIPYAYTSARAYTHVRYIYILCNYNCNITYSNYIIILWPTGACSARYSAKPCHATAIAKQVQAPVLMHGGQLVPVVAATLA